MALKDKLMTLEDFKAVRDVDVASNSAQFTEIKADLGNLDEYRALLMANKDIDISTYTPQPYNLESPSAWAANNMYRCVMIPVEDLAIALVITATTKNVKYAFLRSGTIVAGQAPDLCSVEKVTTISTGNTKEVYVPADCKFMYLYISTWTDFSGMTITRLSYKNSLSEIAEAPMLAPRYFTKIGIIPVELEQGTFSDSGLNFNGATRIRSKRYIPVTPGNKYIVEAFPSIETKAVNVSVSFYTANDYTTPRSAMISWEISPITIIVPANVSYMRVLLTWPNHSNITPDDVPGCIVRKTYKYNTTDYVVTSDLIKKDVKTRYLGVLSYVQAFCKYNGKYYSIDGEHIGVQNSDFTQEATATLNTGHGNALQLGNSGKAYASGWDDHKIYVVDLDDLEVESTITLPTTGYTIAAIDEVNEIAYIFQRDTYPDTVVNYNFIAYDYANQQILSTKKIINAFGGIQACDFWNGNIVVAYGFGTVAVPSGLSIYNTNGDMVADYNLSIFQSVEPEGICFDRATGMLLISLVNKKVYEIALAVS